MTIARILAAARATVIIACGVLLASVLASTCSGCGAGAIATQARAATIATVALEGVHRLAMTETERRLDECADVACTTDVETAMAPVALAYETTRAGLVAWTDAIRLAQVAGDDGDVLGALLVAAGRWLDLWPPLVAAFERATGLDVPDLPPLVSRLLGAP